MVSSDGRLVVVRWLDNKPVNFLSTFLQAEQLFTITRWSKTLKDKVLVHCPNIAREYNRHMGGVDLSDMLMALYRIDLRSKKYYNRIIFYLIGISLLNGWRIYQWNTKDTKMSFLKYIKSVSSSLMISGNKKADNRKSAFAYSRSHPQNDTRYDGYQHFPQVNAERRRCKHTNCNLQTYISCSKCDVYLCVVSGKTFRNCFTDYHSK